MIIPASPKLYEETTVIFAVILDLHAYGSTHAAKQITHVDFWYVFLIRFLEPESTLDVICSKIYSSTRTLFPFGIIELSQESVKYNVHCCSELTNQFIASQNDADEQNVGPGG